MNQLFNTLKLPANHDIINIDFYKEIDNHLTHQTPFCYLFKGISGCGKTTLMKIIHNNIIRLNPVWMTAPTLYQDYIRVISSDFSDKSEAITKRHNLFVADTLFIDDIGVEKHISEAAIGYITIGIHRMYDNWKMYNHKRIVLSTNLNSKEILDMYGSRVVDRLTEMFTVIDFPDKSFRKVKARVVKL